MQTPPNRLKRALREGKAQFGLFCSLPAFVTVEALAPAGFDYFIFDAEHTPTGVPILHMQLAAMAHTDTTPVVRVAANEMTAIKPVLDLGVQTIMVPGVDTAEDAARAVRFTRYPPAGVRGIGGSVRATGYGRNKQYAQTAGDEICVLVQAESAAALRNLDAICAVDGVDAVFFGPNDLAADCGYLGQPAHPQIVAMLEQGIRTVRRHGKVAGILAAEPLYERYVAAGARLIALGSEVGLMAQAADALAARVAK